MPEHYDVPDPLYERMEDGPDRDFYPDWTGPEADADPGLVCMRCATTWCRRLTGLADLDCPSCGATYADVARNVEG